MSKLHTSKKIYKEISKEMVKKAAKTGYILFAVEVYRGQRYAIIGVK